jgi:ectoine hydroxylase-related dioxygenase (phytanoyl-CoA dioxygenase family)
VIPGSHRAGRPPSNESTWNGQSPKMISVKAGGAVMFRHELWHGAGMNSSNRRRYLIQLRYVENRENTHRLRNCSPEVLAAMNARQRTLLGQSSSHLGVPSMAMMKK